MRRTLIAASRPVPTPMARPHWQRDTYTIRTYTSPTPANPWVGQWGGTAITRHPGGWRR
jgi:hypothetical protein